MISSVIAYIIYVGVMEGLFLASSELFPGESSIFGYMAVAMSHLGFGLFLLPAFVIFTFVKLSKFVNRKRSKLDE